MNIEATPPGKVPVVRQTVTFSSRGRAVNSSRTRWIRRKADSPAATPIEPVSLAAIRKPVAIEAKDRDWRDDTGQFGCHGRLVQVSEGKVRILKQNGRHTTVAFERLSEADLAYVRQEATRAATPAVNTTAQK